MVMQTKYFPDQILLCVSLVFTRNTEDQTLSSKDSQFSLDDKYMNISNTVG